jgi:hypothetical protein
MALSTRSRKYMRMARHRPDHLAYQAPCPCIQLSVTRNAACNACLEAPHIHYPGKIGAFILASLSISL